MTTKNNVPQIRFKEVCGEWNEQYLEHIADVLDGDRGFNYPKHEDLQTHGHTLFLSAANVTLDGFKFLNNQYISEEKSSSMGNGKLVVNDIVLTSRGSLGNVAWYNENIQHEVAFARINSGMLILRMKNYISPCIVTHILKSPLGQRKINLISFGSAQPQLTKSGVAKLSLILPQNKFEQKKIGEYFQRLDKLIEQKENKFQKLKQFKKSMLAKMFPVNGADTPSIRFTGFTDNWQKEKLGDIAKITTGSSNRQDSGLDGKYTFFDRSEDIRKSDIYLFDCEAIIVAGEGSDFVPKYFVGKFDLHQRTYAIMSYETGNSKFLFYYIHHFRKWFLSQAVGSTVKSLRLPMFQDMLIQFPQKNEQTKIGNYFKKLDKLIDLQQQELEKLKNLKKAFLAKMFV